MAADQIGGGRNEVVGGPKEVSLHVTTHTPVQQRAYLLALACIILALASVYPWLARSTYRGSCDQHETIEMVGALFGLVAGFALVMRFYVLGNRFHLFIGLAFFVNGAEDFVHGFLSFATGHGLIGIPASSLAQFIPGTYVTGRLLMGVLLLLAPFMPAWLGRSTNPKRETVWTSMIVVFIAVVATAVAFNIPLPRFIFPEHPIARPVDLLSALVLATALLVFLRQYRRDRNMLTWWVSLAIGVNAVGQIMMSFSKELYDPFFDIAHVYKVIGYLVPLLGFSLYQIAVIAERVKTEEALQKAHDQLETRIKERTADLSATNESLQGEITERKLAEEALRQKTHDLGERVNELNCLYGISKLVEGQGISLEEMLQGTADLIPPSWRYPEITCGRVIVDGREFGTENFTETAWKQSCDIIVHGDPVGAVEVCYLEEKPGIDEGPFLKEERKLIDAIAERLGKTIEQRRAEEALRVSENKYRTLIENLPQKVFIKDRNSVYISCNPNYARDLGISPDDIRGKTDYDFYPKELAEKYRADDRKVMESGNTEDIEEQYIQDGREAWVHTAKTPVRDDEGNIVGVLGVFWDITEQKRMEEEKARLETELRHAQKLESIGTLAAGIAHEINTPTQYVGDNTRFLQDSFTDLLLVLEKYKQLFEAAKRGDVAPELMAEIQAAAEQADVEYLAEEVPQAIRQSLEGVERVSTIVRAMKEFSHPGAKEKTAIDINKAIENTITVARNEWKYVADMVTEFDGALPAVPCLPSDFSQVILNLIMNAAQAIAHVIGDGSNGKGQITVSTRRDDGWAEIRISDTGTGIPDAIRDRIFDPFFTTKEVGKGTGQGLAIARSVIADKHGGTIDFESEEGKGTVFTVRLPIDPQSAKNEDGDS